MFADAKFWEALRNNMLWLIVVPAASTAFGLLAAQLTDRIGWGNIAKSLIFMPMAISFVGASVIFKLIYEVRPADQPQIGVMNAVWLDFDGGIWSYLFLKAVPAAVLLGVAALTIWLAWDILRNSFQPHGVGQSVTTPTHKVAPPAMPAATRYLRTVVGVTAAAVALWALWSVLRLVLAEFNYGEPQTWLTIPYWNSFFLMIVLIWIQTGFAMVILSAALRGIPEETIEAAILDGASPFQVFFKIKVPQIMGTIVVVWTTITLVVLKVFDIVFAMTNGQWETQVLANYMFDKLFRGNDWGVGSASAIVIMLLVTPILVWNVYNVRKEMR
jgi:alpha-glucoside transport system permease protein